MDSSIKRVSATGGGSFKFRSLFKTHFPDVELVNHDEMKSLVDGMTYVLENSHETCFKIGAEGK
jgi:pantothenate kinase